MELQVLTPSRAAEAPVLRPARGADHGALMEVWRRSVEASHDFLAPGAVEEIEAGVRRALAAVAELWLVEAGGRPVAFLGCTGPHVEMLFVAPGYFRRGHGTRLLDHARALHGPLAVEVNEANAGARAFYRARGFMLTGRSPVDSAGRPYPLLHLRQPGARERTHDEFQEVMLWNAIDRNSLIPSGATDGCACRKDPEKYDFQVPARQPLASLRA